MSGEIIAILAVGVALTGLNLTSFRAPRDEITGIRSKVAGLLEGLKDAITGRVGSGS